MLNLVPRPKEISEYGDDFRLRGSMTILDLGGAKDASVEQLAEAVKEKTKRAPRILRKANGSRGAATVRLEIDRKRPSLRGPESYELTISGSHISLVGYDAPGLFYAVQTLKQILRKSNGRIAGTQIRDWPNYTERILMYDFARQQHVRMDFLKKMLVRLAELKYNKFMCYLEGRFVFASHPAIGPKGAMTAAQVKELEAFAARLHMEVIPQYNCLGHNEIVLANPLYRHLAEEEATPYQFCSSNPASLKLVKDLTRDMAKAFKSELFHAGGDETGQIGWCPRCKPLAEKKGAGALYADHYRKVFDHLKSLGKKAAIWGDELLAHREVADTLPKDVTIYDWHYTGAAPDCVKFFHSKGFKVTVCPSDSSFSAGTVPYDRPTENVLQYLPDSYKLGVRSMSMTVWEMYRGNFMPNNWYPVALAADAAWDTMHAELSTGHLRSFQRRFCKVFLGTKETTFFDYLRLIAHGEDELYKTMMARAAVCRHAFFGDSDPFYFYLRFAKDIREKDLQEWNRFFRKADQLLARVQREARYGEDMLEMLEFPLEMLRAAFHRVTGLRAASDLYRKLYARPKAFSGPAVRRHLAHCRELVEACAEDCEKLEERLRTAHEVYGAPIEDVHAMRRQAAYFRTYSKYVKHHERGYEKGVPLVEPSALYF